DFAVFVGKYAERGYHLLPEVLVLIIAPDHKDIRLEFVQFDSAPVEAFTHCSTMSRRGRCTGVVDPLPLGKFGPVPGILSLRWDVRILECASQKARHVRVGRDDHRIMGHTHADHIASHRAASWRKSVRLSPVQRNFQRSTTRSKMLIAMLSV